MISAAMAVAGAVGLIAGVSASLASRYLKRRFSSRRLRIEMQRCIRILKKETDGRRFVQTYLLLLRKAGRLVSLQLLTAAAAILPIVAAYLTSSALCDALTTWKSGCIVVMPAATITVSTAEKTRLLNQGQHYYTLAAIPGTSVDVSIDGVATMRIGPLRKQGYSDSVWRRLLLICLGFELLHIDAANRPSISLMLSRPCSDDSNPLWPWLNNAELVFLLAASSGSIPVAVSAFRQVA